MSLRNSYVKDLISNVMLFQNGDLGRQLGLDEVIGLGPRDGINVLIKRDISCLFFLFLHTPGRGKESYEHTARRQPCVSQEEGLH